MNRRGFTIVEIVITLLLISVLLILSVVSLDSAMTSADDQERKSDIETIASYLESYYTSGSQYDSTTGQYPSLDPTNPLTDDVLTTNNNELNLLRNAEPAVFVAPGSAVTTLSSLISATNDDQTTNGIAPQPTTIQYVYQPIANDGTRCIDLVTQTCRKFNLFYRTEADNTVRVITSRHQ